MYDECFPERICSVKILIFIKLRCNKEAESDVHYVNPTSRLNLKN